MDGARGDRGGREEGGALSAYGTTSVPVERSQGEVRKLAEAREDV